MMENFFKLIGYSVALIINPGIILIFLFWGQPDNWDKFNYMIDTHYEQMKESRR